MRKAMLLSLLTLTLIPSAGLGQAPDRREDRWDRREDRQDARENRRDALHVGGPVDRIEDRRDRREDRRDRREDVRDRADREWWRGRHEFAGYAGPRAGYFYAPGYGYYRVTPAYVGLALRAGVILPPPLRHYRVANVALFRLRPAPYGHAWVHVDNDIVLISLASGMILDVLLDVW